MEASWGTAARLVDARVFQTSCVWLARGGENWQVLLT
jgi:hypothetical protein